MSSIQSQFLDLTSHHDRYDAIDPQSALKNSAADKVIFAQLARTVLDTANAHAWTDYTSTYGPDGTTLTDQVFNVSGAPFTRFWRSSMAVVG